MIAGLKKNRTWSNIGSRGIVNIKLDKTITPGVGDFWFIFEQFVVEEMKDLVVNGDTEHATEPFLKAFDGEKKTGKKLTAFSFTSAILEQKPAGKDTAYTLYFKVAPEFGGTVPDVQEKAVNKEIAVERGTEFV